MRAVIQRVRRCTVSVDGTAIAETGLGLAVLLGIGRHDTEKDADFIADKIAGLRIFDDDTGRMNHSITTVGGELMVISQFTLHGDCRRGRRPSYNNAASPEQAEKLYNYLVKILTGRGLAVATGRFRAMMEVALVNDGPVTILLDSKKNF